MQIVFLNKLNLERLMTQSAQKIKIIILFLTLSTYLEL